MIVGEPYECECVLCGEYDLSGGGGRDAAAEYSDHMNAMQYYCYDYDIHTNAVALDRDSDSGTYYITITGIYEDEVLVVVAVAARTHTPFALPHTRIIICKPSIPRSSA